MKKRKNTLKTIVALSLALAVALAAGIFIGQITKRADTGTLILSVNPTIRIDYDKNGTVTSVRGGNADGEAVVASAPDLTGQSCVSAVETLISRINDAGYFGGEQKNILIRLENGSFVPSKTFIDDISAASEGKVQELSLESELITIGEKDYTEGKFGATEYITVGKAKEIAVAHAGATLESVVFEDREFDFERGVAVYELEFYADGVEYEYEIDAVSGEVIKYKIDNDKAQKPVEDTDTGANDGAVLSEELVKQIVTTHAGVSAEEVQFTKLKLERDDGRYEYDVEFTLGSVKYEYEIDAVSGDVLGHEIEEKKPAVTPEPTPDPEPAPTPDDTVTEKPTYIGADRAKQIAIAHAGVSPSRVECEFDRENGRYVYEIEFKVGSYEYEYEIDAISGEILKWKRDFDD